MSKRVACRWLVSGTVQGVGFRFFVQHKATALGVTGWARNRDDGQVEVYGAGTPEMLNDLESALRVGPNLAKVRSVEREEAEQVEPASGFRIN